MHEMGMMREFFECLRREMGEEAGGARLSKVSVSLGKKAGVNKDSFVFWFKLLSQETEFKETALDVVVIEGEEISVDSFETA
jgi:Zn finger protein HypA/HybF involved in hydrogenase expression